MSKPTQTNKQTKHIVQRKKAKCLPKIPEKSPPKKYEDQNQNKAIERSDGVHEAWQTPSAPRCWFTFYD